ncbi:hypothetical protein BO226_24915 (plasmid) [Rhodococcus sp. 2G]|nr:hypothetical protein BO226_24915 [Rhodococcus sp. 2G]
MTQARGYRFGRFAIDRDGQTIPNEFVGRRISFIDDHRQTECSWFPYTEADTCFVLDTVSANTHVPTRMHVHVFIGAHENLIIILGGLIARIDAEPVEYDVLIYADRARIFENLVRSLHGALTEVRFSGSNIWESHQELFSDTGIDMRYRVEHDLPVHIRP